MHLLMQATMFGWAMHVEMFTRVNTSNMILTVAAQIVNDFGRVSQFVGILSYNRIKSTLIYSFVA